MSAVSSDIAPHIRAMQEDDLHYVMRIEEQVYDFPWTSGIFRDCIRIGHVCRVFETEFEVVGYGIMSVAAGECHILNVCVEPNYQRNGLGRAMVEDLIAIAQRNKARIAFLEVRVSNTRASALYQAMGFKEIGRRKDYYPALYGKREHALVLAKVLT